MKLKDAIIKTIQNSKTPLTKRKNYIELAKLIWMFWPIVVLITIILYFFSPLCPIAVLPFLFIGIIISTVWSFFWLQYLIKCQVNTEKWEKEKK
jgi:hypothetical protein